MAKSKLEEALEKYISGTAVTLRAGILEEAKYPDGTQVAQVGYIQEYGAPEAKIPPRPFFRAVINEGKQAWPAILASGVEHYQGDVKSALALLGEQIVGELSQSVRDWNSPPNAPATFAKKGFNKPLIDTGQMANSFSYEVTDD
ncbi:hypothetical protein [Morganella psychrotolerans]|uniref:Uncharacterized protein n=1 Tax=Morganella psychrotolerans TaxID=368603 RepID=A0A1B8HT51_9GAMM|nr:hypothetical protein [Morganella psychrotolerans]OBU12533.1 hypothetical protein AYY18_15490 [Morganella psychrotolerans]